MQRGWPLVILGILISSFLGGAIRVVFSPAKVRQFVESVAARREPKFTLTFSEARLSLGSDWIPQFAVEFRGLEIRAKDPCITSSTITIDRLYVPLRISKFLQKQVQFGHVHARNVRFNYIPASCSSQPVVEEETIDSSEQVARLERYFQNRWSKEVVNSTRYLKRFSMENLQVFADSDRPVFSVLDLSLEFLKAERAAHAEFRFLPGYRLAGVEPFGASLMNVFLRPDEVLIAGHGHLKEGQIKLAGRWAVTTGAFDTELSIRDMPAQHILGLARHWGIFEELPTVVRNVWVGCEVSLRGNARELGQVRLNYEGCRGYGNMGDLEVIPRETKPFSESILPIKIKLVGGDGRRMLESLGFGKTWGVLSQFGKFDGVISVLGPREIELDGDLRDLELFLSSFYGQAREMLSAVKLQLAYKDQRFSGKFSNVHIVDGNVEGAFSFNVSKEGQGVLQFALDRVAFSPTVQRILFAGTLPELAFFGLGQLEASSLTGFEGKIGVREYANSTVAAHEVQADVVMASGLWRIDMSGGEVFIKPESPWWNLSVRIGSKMESRPKELRFAIQNAIVEMDSEMGRWRGLEAKIVDSKATLLSEGQWTRAQVLRGQVGVQYSKTASASWQIDGRWTKPLFTETGTD